MKRYYLISTIIVLVLTFAIGYTTERKSPKELMTIGLWLTLGLALLVGAVVGISNILVVFGVAEKGFIF